MTTQGKLYGKIEKLKISGFRSLANIEVPLSDLSVLIGANGSGKSNIIKFFEMLNWMIISKNLAEFVARNGGADDQLFQGVKKTPRIDAEIQIRTNLGRNDYSFTLAHGNPDKFFFMEEKYRFSKPNVRETKARWNEISGGSTESNLLLEVQNADYESKRKTARVITSLLRDCATFQFHDTSDTSRFNQEWDVDDNRILKAHGGNLSAVLYWLEHNDLRRYEIICTFIRKILPGFDSFELRERYGKVALRWKAKGVDKTFSAHLTSDGSLRFFALATLLNLPDAMLPSVILLDEPELGLHPAAITLIGHMIKNMSKKRQVILATQSPLLVDQFSLESILVLTFENNQTHVKQLNVDDYKSWLDEDYTISDLWQKNVIGGRP